MSDYTKTTNFAAKDSLPSGNSGKIVKGSEIDTEFNNIQTAVATKLNINDSALTGSTSVQTLTVSTLLDITSTTDASDATGDTGALRTEGGASIAKKLFVGTDLDVDGTTNLDVVDIDGAVNMASTALVTGVLTTTAATVHTNGITMPDNAKAIFGTGSDLEIYHDGSNSIISDQGTGNLVLRAGDFRLKNADSSETMILAAANGAVQLYYDNAAKLTTSSTGIDVTGTAVTDGLTVDGSILFGPSTSVVVGGSGAEFQINGTTGNSAAQSITRFGNDANSPILKFGKSRNGTIGSNTIVQSGDNLGIIQFCGDDGTNLAPKAADILGEVDGTPGSNDMPGRLVFRTTADGADTTTERMRITKDGLVGIGIASPNEPLHVFHATRNVLVNIESGDSGAYISFKDNDTTDTDTVFIGAVDNDLKLYAGGSTPRLAVMGSNGTIQTVTAGSNNVRLGLDAGGNITSGGEYNTVIGDSAGAALTGGDSNVAVGFEALATEDGHGRNVAIGYRALKTLNAGTNANNTVVGYGAGVLMTTATQNTFLGSLVGDEVTTGGQNVALGYGALSAETTSSRNVAVGALTLQVQNGGDGQTYNTAVGYNAGNDITTGARNTCVGGLSGDAMTTGTNNTFIGYNTGGTGVVTGADNTALGISAGASLTSGSNNVLIGHDAGVSGSPGGNINNESNEIVIGDDAITQAHVQVDWTVASDQRDKTDFVDLDLGLDFVKALEPVTYYWDKRSKYGDKYTTNEEGDLVLNEDYDLDDFTPDGTHKEDWMDIGFKAQAVQALEEAAGYTTAAKKNLTVSTTADGKQMGLQYSKFVPILVKAIQDQDAIITALTARIEALES